VNPEIGLKMKYKNRLDVVESTVSVVLFVAKIVDYIDGTRRPRSINYRARNVDCWWQEVTITCRPFFQFSSGTQEMKIECLIRVNIDEWEIFHGDVKVTVKSVHIPDVIASVVLDYRGDLPIKCADQVALDDVRRVIGNR
jgi:hypothetical protein